MDFDHSTQARSWMFNTETLSLCREHRAETDCSGVEAANLHKNNYVSSQNPRRVRKFASGFDRRFHKQSQSSDLPTLSLTPVVSFAGKENEEPTATSLSLEEEEVVLRFHANQICKLVGPSALFPELRRSPKVVATAIMLFRRFYLSNNVLDFDCRHVATAAALLGCKLEEERVQAGFLAYATISIYREARATPLYGSELRAISVEGIEAAERSLLEGLNYEMMCFHPADTVRVLASDLSDYFANSCADPVAEHAFHLGEDVHARAQAVCYRALICSDAPFLFAPGRIAFAAATIALRSIECEHLAGGEMEDFLRSRFPNFSEEELATFEEEVDEIVDFLHDCPPMELLNQQAPSAGKSGWNEAEELWQVLAKLANMHTVAKMPTSAPACTSTTATTNTNEPSRKRSRLELVQTQMVVSWTVRRKCPKVTPISQHCSPIVGRE